MDVVRGQFPGGEEVVEVRVRVIVVEGVQVGLTGETEYGAPVDATVVAGHRGVVGDGREGRGYARRLVGVRHFSELRLVVVGRLGGGWLRLVEVTLLLHLPLDQPQRVADQHRPAIKRNRYLGLLTLILNHFITKS